MEDKDATDEEVELGGKMRSLMWLCKHLGIGMDSCLQMVKLNKLCTQIRVRTRYGDLGGFDTYGTHISMAAMNWAVFLSPIEALRLLYDGCEPLSWFVASLLRVRNTLGRVYEMA